MSSSFPLPEWQSGAASSMKGVLTENEWMEIEDVVALTGDRLPEWLQRLTIPQGWHAVALCEAGRTPRRQTKSPGGVKPRGFVVAD